MQKHSIKTVKMDKSIKGGQNGMRRGNIHVISYINRESKLNHKIISISKYIVQGGKGDLLIKSDTCF